MQSKSYGSIAFMFKMNYNEHMFEKKDVMNFIEKNITWLLVSIILLIAFIMYVLPKFFVETDNQIIVLVDGRKHGIYSLQHTQEIKIETEHGYNVLVIENGQAFVAEADCDNQVCVHTQPVSERGGQIICLPHRVVIRLDSAKESEIDAVTN